MQRSVKIWKALFAAIMICGAFESLLAQDVVFLEKSSGDGETKRKGEIVKWEGDRISIKGKTGVKTFDSNLLVRIETAWHPGFDAGKKLQAAFRYDDAITQLESALENEPRSWMQNIVHAKLVECHLAKEDFGNAARHFLKTIDDDPQSRFRHLAPLVWTSSRPDQQQLKRAESLMSSADPMIALLGASWFLNGSDGEKAKSKMEMLARDFDPVVASMAKAQLWRLDKLPPNEKRMAVRIEQTWAMPEEVRCGAWYQIAQAQSKSKMPDEAIVNFMRIPINDAGQGALSAAALYQAASLLEKKNALQSQALRKELKEKFGDTVWAR